MNEILQTTNDVVTSNVKLGVFRCEIFGGYLCALFSLALLWPQIMMASVGYTHIQTSGPTAHILSINLMLQSVGVGGWCGC